MPLADAVFATTFTVYSTVSTRRFMHHLSEAVAKKYLSRPGHYNSICASRQGRGLTPVSTDRIKASAVPLRAVEKDFAVDRTGFGVSRFVRWQPEKDGVTRSGPDWVKAPGR